MTEEAKQLQEMLDCTCGARVADNKKYPFAVASKGGQSKYLILDEKTEILLQKWQLFITTGQEMLNSGVGVEIPFDEAVAELRALLDKSMKP